MSMLVYLEMSLILEFLKNLGCINEPNIKGFLAWWELVKNVFLFTLLVMIDTPHSLGLWHFARKANNMFELLYNMKT
jgi:hypothetical protein